jgi:hypothetical protein
MAAFIKKLHAAWPDFDIHFTEIGHWLPVPMTGELERSIPKIYDNEDLQKLMDQVAKEENASRKINAERQRMIKKEQLKQVKRQQNSGAEPRKPMSAAAAEHVKESQSRPHPFQGASVSSSALNDEQ